VGNGVSTVASSAPLAPLTTTLNTVVNGVASATPLTNTTGGSAGAGNTDPLGGIVGGVKGLLHRNAQR